MELEDWERLTVVAGHLIACIGAETRALQLEGWEESGDKLCAYCAEIPGQDLDATGRLVCVACKEDRPGG